MSSDPAATLLAQRWSRWALATIVVVSLLRLVVASRVGLGDAEAYYWVWSQQLAGGYFDHGPLVAFLIRAGTWLFVADSTLAVRMPFVVLSAVTMFVVVSIARRQLGATAQGPFVGLLLLLSMPMFLIAGGAANPDVPFILLVAAFIALSLKAVASAGRTVWVAAAGAALGLAFCAKFFALLLLPALLFVALRAPRRSLAVVAALTSATLFALPPVMWNVAHGFPSLRYHFVERHTSGVGLSWANLGKLIGGQIGYVSPLVLPLMIAAIVVCWRRREQPQYALLLRIALPLLGCGYLLILLVPSAEPHWPAAGYLPLLPVVATMMPSWWRQRRAVRWLVIGAVALSALLAAAFHTHVLSDAVVRLMPTSYQPRFDLANELRGWPRVSKELRRLRLVYRRTRRPMLVAGCHYTVCSQLAFVANRRFRVLCPSPRRDQFDYLHGGDGQQLRDVDLIYVRDELRFPFSAAELYRCGQLKEVGRLRIRRALRVVRRFAFELCLDFQGLRAQTWPPH
ncbi:MAG: glycosyltransferase family 39 protein [Deltaproteobacteria bacterium]|nr:glycosyltransferase family 39 protein [Deltaproteobacteria bacterium]